MCPQWSRTMGNESNCPAGLPKMPHTEYQVSTKKEWGWKWGLPESLCTENQHPPTNLSHTHTHMCKQRLKFPDFFFLFFLQLSNFYWPIFKFVDSFCVISNLLLNLFSELLILFVLFSSRISIGFFIIYIFLLNFCIHSLLKINFSFMWTHSQ